MTRAVGLFYPLLSHLFLVCIGLSCVPSECKTCNISAECCRNHLNNNNQCSNVFNVSINSTKSELSEGDEVNLTCVHNLPSLNLTFAWFKNGEKITDKNEATLNFTKILSADTGEYVCSVNSICGSCKSLPLNVTVPNESIIIMVICGVAALVLVIGMGLAMKFKLNRDNAKHKARMRQREQAQQNNGPSR
ncbi:uncharacterized protein LOC121643292 [Melanotaenia boesemani]|uniref:uncharacterized protein LOC121643292 n=1 Tax=Melanotaenia boesemani TaxID=1250792 RepID=UPI001C05C596|nr:uncharacterized protein LOC121643292 [Melanotaenia boesemani]